MVSHDVLESPFLIGHKEYLYRAFPLMIGTILTTLAYPKALFTSGHPKQHQR